MTVNANLLVTSWKLLRDFNALEFLQIIWNVCFKFVEFIIPNTNGTLSLFITVLIWFEKKLLPRLPKLSRQPISNQLTLLTKISRYRFMRLKSANLNFEDGYFRSINTDTEKSTPSDRLRGIRNIKNRSISCSSLFHRHDIS